MNREPAFPVLPQHNGYAGDCSGPGYGASTGMSLRDWFAAHAPQVGIDELAYVLGYPDEHPREPWELTPEQKANGVKCVREIYRSLPGPEKFAASTRFAYIYADSMMKARDANT